MSSDMELRFRVQPEGLMFRLCIIQFVMVDGLPTRREELDAQRFVSVEEARQYAMSRYGAKRHHISSAALPAR